MSTENKNKILLPRTKVTELYKYCRNAEGFIPSFRLRLCYLPPPVHLFPFFLSILFIPISLSVFRTPIYIYTSMYRYIDTPSYIVLCQVARVWFLRESSLLNMSLSTLCSLVSFCHFRFAFPVVSVLGHMSLMIRDVFLYKTFFL